MSVHLIKLCVGADLVEDLSAWIGSRQSDRRRRGEPAEHIHTTRMTPSRRAELLDGGSLYWVIRGVIQCRQQLIDIRPVVDGDGLSRCQLVMLPELVLVSPRPRGPFQGWRYLEAADAPQDIAAGADTGDMPLEMRRELAELGLL